MSREAIRTTHAPQAIGPYSQAIRAGSLVFCSGQIPLDPKTGMLVGEADVRIQVDQVMRNLQAVLEAANCEFEDVVKATIFLTDLADFAVMNEVYTSYFEGKTPPARSTIQVAALPRGARVEIEMTATKG